MAAHIAMMEDEGLMGVILVPLIIPWPYFWAHYMKAPQTRGYGQPLLDTGDTTPKGGDQ